MNAIQKTAKRLERLRLSMPAHPPGREGLAAPLKGVFNPTFAPAAWAPGADMAVLCRETYYALDARSYMVGAPEIEKARNIVVGLAADGNGMRETTRRHVPSLDALEDVRVYGFQGETYFSAVRLNPPPKRLHSPVIGTLSPDLSARIREPDEHVDPVEKNWVFFRRDGGLWIEKWPGGNETYKVDPVTLTLDYTLNGEINRQWSGTKSAPFEGGDLFLDHRRIYLFDGGKLPVRFVYRLRYQLADGGPAKLSRVFSLHRHDRLVYASDIAVADDKVRIGFGIDDAEASFHEMSVAEARTFVGLAR